MPPGTEEETPADGEGTETEVVDEGDEEEESENGGSFNAVSHIDQLVGERGGGEKAAKALARKFFWENKKLRSKLRSARKRAVDEKDLVLKGPEAEATKKLLALGKPDEVLKKVSEHGEMTKKLKESEHIAVLGDIADRLGFTSKRGKRAFINTAKREGIDIQDREVTEEDPETGKKTKVLRPMAKFLTEGDDKFRPIEDVVEDDLRDYLPAFQAEDDDESSSESRESVTRDTPTHRKGIPMVSQSRTTGTPSNVRPERAAVTRQLDARYKSDKKK